MKKTKTAKRAEWMVAKKDEINMARTDDHTNCKGNCYNGYTCYNQSSGGYGWIAKALREAGIDPESHRYWTGSAPTPSTSINKGIANYLASNAPGNLMGD